MKTPAVSLLCLLLTYANASTQNTPHETWGQQPANEVKSLYLPVNNKTAAKVVSTLDVYNSYQVNLSTSGLDIIADAANEPSIAVNPINPLQMAIGWRQFNRTRSDFRQAGAAYSNDGGKTWHNAGPIEPGVFRSDPVLSSDAEGRFFYQSLKVLNLNSNNPDFRVDQWQSNNGGRTWQNKVHAYGGDKSWYAIDDTNGPGRGNIYAAWNVAGNPYFPSTFNYSVDNGQSYSTPEEISNKPVFGTVAVGFDGEVYVAGADGDTDQLSDIYLLRSNNITAQLFPEFEQVTAINLGGPIAIGDVNPLGLLGQIWVATDKSNRHTRGRVYVLASVDPAGPDRLDVNFARSTDGGNSFDPFQRINQDLEFVNRQWFGTMAVAPNGRIDVIWLDTRGAPLSGALPASSTLYYSYSYDGGITFSTNQAISQPFFHFLGYPTQRKMGDYIDMVSDNKGAHIAYTATFSGGQDVYYLYAKPSMHEENPYFPAHEVDNAWYDPERPRQGIFSKTLVQNPYDETPQLFNFEAVFTYTPDGQPMWFTLQNLHPITGDSMRLAVLMPTGDLSEGGQALKAIGVAVKSRLYDEQGELIKNRMAYHFDMTEAVIEELQDIVADSGLFDPTFYYNNPFYNTELAMEVQPLIPVEQSRATFCGVHGQALVTAGKPAEGRIQFNFERDDKVNIFGANFTYLTTTNEQGQTELLLDEHGLATPTWQTINSLPSGVSDAGSVTNQIDQAVGGIGFFAVTDTQPDLLTIGNEEVTNSNTTSFSVVEANGDEQQVRTMALNSYCQIPAPL